MPGELAAAEGACRTAHRFFEVLAAADPHNAEWQRDLSVSWNKVGDVRVARGDLEGAREAYEAALAIMQRLAAADPENTEWQRDLSVSWDRLGDLRLARGDLDGAQEAYEARHAIARRLAAADPRNAEWQWDLVVSLSHLAGLAERRGDPVTALGHRQEAARIARALAATGRLAPADARMPAGPDRRLAAARELAGRGGGGDRARLGVPGSLPAASVRRRAEPMEDTPGLVSRRLVTPH